MMNIYTTSITFLQAISMIKRGESHHAYLNNARDNKWALSIQSTTSGKTEEKTSQEKISRLLTTLKGQKDPRLRAWIHIHTAALLHLNKVRLERRVFTEKRNWQVTLKWPDKILKGDYRGKTHYELQFSTGLTCKHDKCLIPWKRVGGKKPFSGRHCGDDMSTQDCSIICLSNHNNTTCFPLRVNCNVEEQAKASNSIFARACCCAAFLSR